METPDSLPEMIVLQSNEEATERGDDAVINNGGGSDRRVIPLPHIPPRLEEAEAMEGENIRSSSTTTTTPEPTTTTVATTTVPMSECLEDTEILAISGAHLTLFYTSSTIP